MVVLGFFSGYFTSRPALKGYVREMNNLLQVCKHMEAFSQILGLKRNTEANTRRLSEYTYIVGKETGEVFNFQHLFLLEEAMGVVQHHDAVS